MGLNQDNNIPKIFTFTILLELKYKKIREREKKKEIKLIHLSKQPIYISISLVITILNTLLYRKELLIISMGILGYNIYLWFKELEIEYTILGFNTKKEKNIIMYSYILFLFSEFLIFLSLFFVYFYFSFSPSLELNRSWIPLGIEEIDSLSIPLLNTLLLINSGLTITAAQLINNKRKKLILIEDTVSLTIYFLFFQIFEYYYSTFDVTSSVFGNIFFFLTGFHGLHVIINIIFILIQYYRVIKLYNYNGLLLASIYAHYVDIIWILLYIFIYIF